MSVLVNVLRLRNRFFPGYASRLAQGYEEHRQNARWQREAKAFEQLYARVKPSRVLDCPVGTGRWLPSYHKGGASAVGVDLSEHMLAEARKKVVAGARVDLVFGDALDAGFLPPLGSFDLIVCTRFVHWLPPKDLSSLAANFAATGSRHLMIEAKIEHEAGAATKRPAPDGRTGIRKRIKDRLHRNIVNHVHNEERFLGILRANGWNLVAREPVIHGPDFRTFLYLMERLPG